jgi:hypothetical protein
MFASMVDVRLLSALDARAAGSWLSVNSAIGVRSEIYALGDYTP